MSYSRISVVAIALSLFVGTPAVYAQRRGGGSVRGGTAAPRASGGGGPRVAGGGARVAGGSRVYGGSRVAGGARVNGGSRAVVRVAPRSYPRSYGYGYGYGRNSGYRPSYAFRPRISVGFGIWAGYPYFYGYYGSSYPYPYYDYPPYAYSYPAPYAYSYPSPYPYASAPSYRDQYPAGNQYPAPSAPPNPAPQGTSGSVGVQRGSVITSGGISFEITPATAGIYVDGTYVGTVGQFGPNSQPLSLSAGRHHIEIREPGYQTVAFDEDIVAGQLVPYQGTMQR